VGEFDLIARVRARAERGGQDREGGVILGIGDDAALLRGRAGWDLVVATDTLNEGVHFPVATAADHIGWKALAVNLSDLAAMGAEPAWCTLSLSLPQPDAEWMDAFLDGFLGLAAEAGIRLVGGDTTRGPLSLTVTAMGQVEAGAALRRDGARVGDDVWVTGTLGDAAAGLALHAAADRPAGFAELIARLQRPTPRLEVGRRLAGLAHACIDVSDGLLADVGHVCRASGVGARIEAAWLPTSSALRACVPQAATRMGLQATGGDDYELCFTAPVAVREQVAAIADFGSTPMTRIGQVVAEEGVRLYDADGGVLELPRMGYEHFGGAALD